MLMMGQVIKVKENRPRCPLQRVAGSSAGCSKQTLASLESFLTIERQNLKESPEPKGESHLDDRGLLFE